MLETSIADRFLRPAHPYYALAFTPKDTGQKRAHLERQLRSGPSLSDELDQRLAE